MENLRAQTSLEFLFAVGLMVLIFAMASLIFFQSQNDASSLSSYLESSRICHELAAQISAVDSAGNGTAAALSLPQTIAGRNYSIFVSASNRSVSVSYGEQFTGCALSTTGISNGTSGDFYLNIPSSTATNIGNGVAIG